jgi:spermidine synthase
MNITFWLLPSMGMFHTAVVLVLANFIGAVGILAIKPKQARKTEAAPISSGVIHGDRILYIVLFVTGLAGIGFEVLIVRALSQILENTVFSFASMLMVFLFGTAAGAAIYHRAGKGRDHYREMLFFLLMCTALFCLVSIYGLRYVDPVFLGLQQLFGGSFRGTVFAEIALSFTFFLLPALFMGATFSHLARCLRDQNGGVGRALCLNTLGGACAPLLFGVLVLPQIGIHYALLTIPAAYLLCFPRRRLAYAAAAGSLLIATIFLGLKSDPYRLLTLEAGDTVVSHQEGVMASVSVVKDARDELHLKVNNHFQMGGTTSVFSDKRQAYLPLLLHPSPKQALFLGVGTGTTFAAAADFPDLMGEGVELIPEVIAVIDHFEKATGNLAAKKNLRILNADARRYVHASHEVFDVIVADLFHPARDGAGFLYTVEHFDAIRSRLAPGGIFCQWLPLYQMDLEVLRIIIRTFLHVFPDGKGFLATYSLQTPIFGLISGCSTTGYPLDYMEKRLSSDALHRRLVALRLNSIYALFGTYLASPGDLRDFAGEGSMNIDNRPVIIFKAPKFAYNENEPAYVRLLALVDTLNPDPEQLLQKGKTDEARAIHDRLRAYWTARDRFLHAGVGVRQTASVERMLDQVQEPLLAIVRQSPDFESAYNPLLAMAQQLHKKNPDAARRLLIELEAANPNRQDARRMREYLYN